MTFGGVEFNAEVTLSCRIIVIQMKVQTNVKKVREQFVDSILSPNNTSVHMKISRWTESTENMSHANWLQCAQLLNTIQFIIYKIAAAAQTKQINWIQNERKRKKKNNELNEINTIWLVFLEALYAWVYLLTQFNDVWLNSLIFCWFFLLLLFDWRFACDSFAHSFWMLQTDCLVMLCTVFRSSVTHTFNNMSNLCFFFSSSIELLL